MTAVKAKNYGVDLSSHNPTDCTKYKGYASFAIVKVSEGTSYQNPSAKKQLDSAKANGMMQAGYHFATFGASESAAKSEANYAVKSAKSAGLPAGTYFACDWETGSGNNVNGGKKASATAILAFMKVVKYAGYTPLLYSGAYLLKNNVETSTITAKYGTCLWVASYPSGNGTRVDTANFNYFPSMDGVAIWQFTDNWRGWSVDGNINVVELKDSITSTWVKNSGIFTLNTALNIHTKANIDAPSIAKLPKGSVVKYDSTLQGPLRLWLRQPRSNGTYGYIVGKDKYGKALGTFS
ncbi:GH25 family lysozyme [Lactobacillus sp.]|uniref:GH25 family lysozyme n=1 Tax=Lactobacillus sp. TaxID=1591 RepID=UPI001990C5BE|nr:GH25 family lysozyme [Lactobacillus sp.]MBD5429353.1 lysin [Lactobacillus sp.]